MILCAPAFMAARGQYAYRKYLPFQLLPLKFSTGYQPVEIACISVTINC